MERRIVLISIECLIFQALYFATASLAAWRHVQTPWTVTALDRVIPFMPVFVWFYLSAYLLDTVGLCLAVWHLDDTQFRGVLVACYATLLMAIVCFLLVPRMALKPAVNTSSALGLTMAAVQQLTTKYNTFPSLHVAYSVITAWAAWMSYARNRLLSSLLMIDALAVIASTVLVKEHTVIDVGGGLVVAAISIVLARYIDPTRVLKPVQLSLHV
ncbi:MAG TPA: phosphatase PAP2 family protein [Vicinamibacterales bacterium]